MLFVPDARVLFDGNSVDRHIDSSYLRFFTHVFLNVFGPVSVSKTYRHLRLGGIASRAGIIGQQDYVPVSEFPHVFDSVIVKAYHFTSLRSAAHCRAF